MFINGINKFNKISVSKLENKTSNPITEEKQNKTEQTTFPKVSSSLLNVYNNVVSFSGTTPNLKKLSLKELQNKAFSYNTQVDSTSQRQLSKSESLTCFMHEINTNEKISKFLTLKDSLGLNDSDAAFCTKYELNDEQIGIYKQIINSEGFEYIDDNQELKTYKFCVIEAAQWAKSGLKYNQAQLKRYSELKNKGIEVRGVRSKGEKYIPDTKRIIEYIKQNKSDEDIATEMRLYDLLEAKIPKKDAVIISKSGDLTRLYFEEKYSANQLLEYQKKGFDTEQQITLYEELKNQGKDEELAVNIALTGNIDNVDTYLEMLNSGLTQEDAISILSNPKTLERYNNFLETKMTVDIKDVAELAEFGLDNFEQLEAFKHIDNKLNFIQDNEIKTSIARNLAINPQKTKEVFGVSDLSEIDFSKYTQYSLQVLGELVKDEIKTEDQAKDLKLILENLSQDKDGYEALKYSTGELLPATITGAVGLAINPAITKEVFGCVTDLSEIDFSKYDIFSLPVLGKLVKDEIKTVDQAKDLRLILENLSQDKDGYEEWEFRQVTITGAVGLAINPAITKEVFGCVTDLSEIDFSKYGIFSLPVLGKLVKDEIKTVDQAKDLRLILENLSQDKDGYEELKYSTGEIRPETITGAVGFAIASEKTKKVFGVTDLSEIDFSKYNSFSLQVLGELVKDEIKTVDQAKDLRLILENLSQDKDGYKALKSPNGRLLPATITGAVGLAINPKKTKEFFDVSDFSEIDFSKYTLDSLKALGELVKDETKTVQQAKDFISILENLSQDENRYKALKYSTGELRPETITGAVGLAINPAITKAVFDVSDFSKIDFSKYDSFSLPALGELVKDEIKTVDQAKDLRLILENLSQDKDGYKALKSPNGRLLPATITGAVGFAINPQKTKKVFGCVNDLSEIDFSKYDIFSLPVLGKLVKDETKTVQQAKDFISILENLSQDKDGYKALKDDNGRLLPATITGVVGLAINPAITKEVFDVSDFSEIDFSKYTLDSLKALGELVKDEIKTEKQAKDLRLILENLSQDKKYKALKSPEGKLRPETITGAVGLAINSAITKEVFGCVTDLSEIDFSKYNLNSLNALGNLVRDTALFTQEQTDKCINYINTGIKPEAAIKLVGDEKYQKIIESEGKRKLTPEQAAFFALNTSLTSFDPKQLKLISDDVWSKLTTGENLAVHNLFDQIQNTELSSIEMMNLNSSDIDISDIKKAKTANNRPPESYTATELEFLNENSTLKCNILNNSFDVEIKKAEIGNENVLFVSNKNGEKETYVAYKGAIVLIQQPVVLTETEEAKAYEDLKSHANISTKQIEHLVKASKNFIVKLFDENNESIISKGLTPITLSSGKTIKAFNGKDITDAETKEYYEKIFRQLHTNQEYSVENIVKLIPKDAIIQINPYITYKGSNETALLHGISAEWESSDRVKWELRTHSADLVNNATEDPKWTFRLGHTNPQRTFFVLGDRTRFMDEDSNMKSENTHNKMNTDLFESKNYLISNNFHFSKIMRQISLNFNKGKELTDLAQILGINVSSLNRRSGNISQAEKEAKATELGIEISDMTKSDNMKKIVSAINKDEEEKIKDEILQKWIEHPEEFLTKITIGIDPNEQEMLEDKYNSCKAFINAILKERGLPIF